MRDFLIGLGGSATVDGGAGMARALGFRLIGADGAPLGGAPRDLARLGRIDDSGAHQAIPLARFRALADVENPLLGPAGAVAVYAPQKGATPASLPLLERGLERLAERLGDWRRIDPAALASLPGAGAGGGLGLGCRSFLGADLTPGAPFIMDRLGFAGRLAGADLVVTGEGSFDAQSLHGKAAARVLEAAAAAGRPAALVAGRWDGALPARLPAGLRVFTASDLPGGGLLDEPGLVETGRRIAAWASESL